MVSVRRADGRKILLGDVPLAQVMREATTIRAVKIVIEVPDRRQVTTLINVTPIRARQGEVG